MRGDVRTATGCYRGPTRNGPSIERYFGSRDQFTASIGRRLNLSLATLRVIALVEWRATGKKINKLDARAIALNRS